jgi:hypothetical protein
VAEIRALASDTADTLIQLVEGTMAVADGTEAMGVLIELARLERAVQRAEEFLARTIAAEQSGAAVPNPLVYGEASIRAMGERHHPGDLAGAQCIACGNAWPCDASTATAFAIALADASSEWRRAVDLALQAPALDDTEHEL